jgi:hypothetical protein
MANEKISQMPAAATLTGSELVELVQAGVNVQSTVATLASQAGGAFAGNGNPNGVLSAALANQLLWAVGEPSLTASGQIVASCNGDPNSGWHYSGNGAFGTGQAPNGSGANLAASVNMGWLNTTVTANTTYELNNSSFYATNPELALYRLLTNGLPIAGFTMTIYFALLLVVATETMFIGFAPSGGVGSYGAFPTSQVMANLLNCVGFGFDNGDTDVSFIYNNGSGTATKSSLGITPAALANQLLKLVITCDGAGNVNFTLTNLESGGNTYSLSVPTATAKLPVANQLVQPHIFVGNGSTASNARLGVKNIFITTGFMA